jgi:hypothetical protein
MTTDESSHGLSQPFGIITNQSFLFESFRKKQEMKKLEKQQYLQILEERQRQLRGDSEDRFQIERYRKGRRFV